MWLNLRELVRYRALCRTLVERDLRARYRGSVLGFIWTFLNPVFLTLVYTFVFSVVVRSNLPAYPFFLMTGLLPWIWFSTSVATGCTAISDRRDLVARTKVPPQILPTVAVLSGAMNFFFSLPILLGLALVLGRPLALPLLALPLIVVIQLGVCQAVALFLSSANVFFRDLQHIVQNVLLFVFFLCPVIYPIEQVPAEFRFLLEYNPLTHLLSAYQDVFYYGRWPAFEPLALLFLGAVVIYWLANRYYDRYKESFPELA